MEEMTEKTNNKTSIKEQSANAPAFKPSILIRRKQTRRIVAQVDEDIADLADEYVRFVSECFGYEVSHGEVMNEIYKSHFARDGGFKQWRTSAKSEANSSV